MNFKELDLTVGIEIHQELDTTNKLFCQCPPRLQIDKSDYNFLRKLRPSQSELGEVDPAALFEFLKGNIIEYQADHETVCLVEMDEEPPGPLNREALDLAITFGLMVGSRPVDEVHVMRKTVVDGSNTGGFQRTCVTALGGEITLNGKKYGLQQICLEEDAARKVAEEDNKVTYKLDRLGIPLMEITTAPDIHSPEEARLVAERIGSLLRSTGKVKRGLGTIRQDLNVSIKGGSIIEIKGVQDLKILSKVVEYEAKRQANLLEIKEELHKRDLKKEKILDSQINVSEVFNGTQSSIIKNALKKGGSVWAVKLPGFTGLTGKELCPGRRLGTELSEHAQFKGGVKGIFHTDEVPAYGLTENEILALRTSLNSDEGDSIVFVADEDENCHKALTAVVLRARSALDGVPEETRSANPDGTTRYTRPRPGSARMYPETDIQLINISPDRIQRLKKNLPELPELKLERFQMDYNLNHKLASQVVGSDYMELFEEISNELPVEPTLVAVTLTEDLTKLKRDGHQVETLEDGVIEETFKLFVEKRLVRESIPDLLAWLSDNLGSTHEDGLRALNLVLLTESEILRIINSKIENNKELVKNRGKMAFGAIMGMVMSEIRGKADAADVQRLIRQSLEKKVSVQ
jgi:glutamyl-tRNA(Gln) amidotransferase subunit E